MVLWNRKQTVLTFIKLEFRYNTSYAAYDVKKDVLIYCSLNKIEVLGHPAHRQEYG